MMTFKPFFNVVSNVVLASWLSGAAWVFGLKILIVSVNKVAIKTFDCFALGDIETSKNFKLKTYTDDPEILSKVITILKKLTI